MDNTHQRTFVNTLDAIGAIQPADGSFRIQFQNTGRAAAVFHVRFRYDLKAPRIVTVQPLQQLTESFPVAAGGAAAYSLFVDGPRGFHRAFKGGVSGRHSANLLVRATYDEENNGITLEISNRAAQFARVSVVNRYTSRSTKLMIWPGDSESRSWSLARASGGYDLTMTVEEDSRFEYHLAGRLEDGEDSSVNPATCAA